MLWALGFKDSAGKTFGVAQTVNHGMAQVARVMCILAVSWRWFNHDGHCEHQPVVAFLSFSPHPWPPKPTPNLSLIKEVTCLRGSTKIRTRSGIPVPVRLSATDFWVVCRIRICLPQDRLGVACRLGFHLTLLHTQRQRPGNVMSTDTIRQSRGGLGGWRTRRESATLPSMLVSY